MISSLEYGHCDYFYHCIGCYLIRYRCLVENLFNQSPKIRYDIWNGLINKVLLTR